MGSGRPAGGRCGFSGNDVDTTAIMEFLIIIIAIIAITHEFAHGIFAAYSKVKIKKTGFGFFPFFLPVFLAAFVELDEKKMATKKKKDQLAILSAGTFANILTALLFFFVLWGFFAASFAPAGVTFDTYSYSLLNTSSIISINGIALTNLSYDNILSSLNETGFSKVITKQGNYYLDKDFLTKEKGFTDYIFLYDDTPALKAGLTGAITEINGIKTPTQEELANVFYTYHPGDEITITTKTSDGKTIDYNVVLSGSRGNLNVPVLGISFLVPEKKGISGILYSIVSLMKKPHVYYEATFAAAQYIYDLLWWLVLISLSVALVNMLPMGIFDGGRFFMLTIWGITKKKKIAEIAFKIMTYLFLFFVLLIMVFWALRIF